MFFCETYFLNEMPFDPTLDYLFTGEEILNSVKFYTNGWDVFVPKINIIFHEYLRDNKPKYWNEPKIIFDDRKALNKVRYYLLNNNNKTNNPYYNNYKLGSIRTLKDYYKFANININKYYSKKTNLIYITIFIFIVIMILIYSFYSKIKNDLFFIK
jgi:UDP-GlcNAc:polypeptide alpha-N-acetylglucosaminyltransferase